MTARDTEAARTDPTLTTDPAAWDAFVERDPRGSYLQLDGWARVKAVNGWAVRRVYDSGGRTDDGADPATTGIGVRSEEPTVGVRPGPGQIAADGDRSPVGAQVLTRRAGPLPWAFAYAPRGPVLGGWGAEAVGRFTEQARVELGAVRASHLRIDPEVERNAGPDAGGAVETALRGAGWQAAPPVQPVATRVIDLTADEDALWGDLRKKWRQYVNKARTGGVRIVEADGARLDDFYRIYRETADRAGFLIRARSAYRDVWDAFGPSGRARLLFAELADGAPVATLFLVRAGSRVVEPYGGMTAAGADSRANYLLKWEAIRRSREAGATTYDLWGLAHAGIAHFKTGFGGREVAYIGSWDLVLNTLGRRTYSFAVRTRVRVERLRHGVGRAGGNSASGYAGAPGTGGADADGDGAEGR